MARLHRRVAPAGERPHGGDEHVAALDQGRAALRAVDVGGCISSSPPSSSASARSFRALRPASTGCTPRCSERGGGQPPRVARGAEQDDAAAHSRYRTGTLAGRRLWIDMTAPAHPLVFRPIIQRLRARRRRGGGDRARLRADARAARAHGHRAHRRSASHGGASRVRKLGGARRAARARCAASRARATSTSRSPTAPTTSRSPPRRCGSPPSTPSTTSSPPSSTTSAAGWRAA